MEKSDEKEFVALAKEIIQKCNLNVKVERLTDCNDEFFVLLYKGLIGDNIKGLTSSPVNEKDHIHNCKCVIDSLANDVLNVDLSHINAKGIVIGDVISIKNLLEIFSGLLEYFMECIDENQSDFEDDLDDSNIMTADHDVISSLLKEEFGSSYTDHSRKDKDTDFKGKRVRPNDSRMTTDPSLRLSSFTGSGHEADFSEVSDSTNDLIKLGESSSSGNSSGMKSESLQKLVQKKSAQTTWQHSALSDNDNYQELTQYTISSDEGERDSFNARDKNQSSDHLSSSLMSSTSSWRQQISPLDADDNGLKLDTIGLRPKADKENVPSSHYSKLQDYRDIPGNIKTSAQVTSAMLPGTSSNLREPLPDNLAGQLLSRQSLPETSVYTNGIRNGLPGSSRVTSLSREAASLGAVGTLPDNSRLGQSIPRQSSHLTSQNVLPKGTSSGLAGQRIPVSNYSTSSIPGVGFRSNVSATEVPVSVNTRTGQTGYSSSITGISSSMSSRGLAGLTGQYQTTPGSSAFQTSVTGQDTRIPRTGLSERTPIPGMSDQFQLRTSWQEDKPLGSVVNTATKTILPGQDYTVQPGQTDDARLRTSLQADKPITSIYTRDLPTTQPTSHRSTLSDPLRLRDPNVSNVPGQRSLLDQYSSYKGLTTTTSLPSSSGLQTVSSGGYSDVFTSTDMNKQYVPPSNSRSLDTRRQRESKELHKTLESEVSTTSKEDKRLMSHGVQAESSGQDVEPVDSESEDAARYSDSAIDYNRGDDQADSDNESSEDSILRRIHDRWKRIKTGQSTKPSAQRAVTFNDDIETIPITSRMDRLRRLLDDEEDEQRQQTATLRNVYAEQLQDIQKQQQRDRNEMKKRKGQKSPLVPKKKAKKTAPSKQRGRLEAVYRPQGRPGRPTKRRPVKTRKRSASASPDIGRRRKSTLAEFQETLLPSLFEEFPFLHVSPQTTHSMWQKQARQISLLSKSETAPLKTKGQRRVEEAEKRQEQLLQILRKELEHNERMRSERERQDHQRTIKAKVNEKRQVAARARRYYDEYQLRMRAKMLKRRTREEQILKKLFDDGLEIQKQRVRELRKYAKDKSEAIEQRQSNEIESLENYYKDQFSMLAEDMTRERQEMKVRQHAQEKVMRQMRRELRKKMEKEIEDLQETLTRDEDSAYFRQLEADRLRREFQLAMYKSDL